MLQIVHEQILKNLPEDVSKNLPKDLSKNLPEDLPVHDEHLHRSPRCSCVLGMPVHALRQLLLRDGSPAEGGYSRGTLPVR